MSNVNKYVVIRHLRELSDYNFQHQHWLSALGPLESSFTRSVDGLFGDSGLAQAFKEDESIFSNNINIQLKILSEELQNVDGLIAEQGKLINSDKMYNIRILAITVLNQIELEEPRLLEILPNF